MTLLCLLSSSNLLRLLPPHTKSLLLSLQCLIRTSKESRKQASPFPSSVDVSPFSSAFPAITMEEISIYLFGASLTLYALNLILTPLFKGEVQQSSPLLPELLIFSLFAGLFISTYKYATIPAIWKKEIKKGRQEGKKEGRENKKEIKPYSLTSHSSLATDPFLDSALSQPQWIINWYSLPPFPLLLSTPIRFDPHLSTTRTHRHWPTPIPFSLSKPVLISSVHVSATFKKTIRVSS